MSRESALALIESVKDSRVLFVGDTIIDEYQFVTPLGKSPKENLIPVKFHSSETFTGGVEAAANHLRTFCQSVTIRTNANGVRKVRMVEKHNVRKLFEVHYNGMGSPLIPYDGAPYDCVVVTDFGHGCIGPQMIEWLCKQPFMAVNAQTNSSNIGFNLITKYRRANYMVIDEPEARLAAQNRDGPIEEVMAQLANGRCEKMVVTLGHHGAIGYEGGHFTSMAAMSRNVVDTMGAGDAFFAVTAPMAKHGSMEDLLLIGNAAGALKTQVVGHRTSVTKEALCEFVRAH